MILFDLFLVFFKVGLFSIGGGYASMPIIQNEALYNYGWLTAKEFNNLVTFSEMTPGSITINAATFVGLKVDGVVGALVATFSVIAPALVVLTLLSLAYYRYRRLPLIQNCLLALRPTIVALIFSVCLTMFKTNILSPNQLELFMSLAIFAFAFLMITKFKKSPLITMIICGLIYLIFFILFLN